MDKQKLKAGFQEAKMITKNFAKTFYLASLFLPKDQQSASYAVYAICRLSDETVDNLNCRFPQTGLQKLEQDIALAYSDKLIEAPLLEAFRHTVLNYRIPKEYFDTLIKGMYMDLEVKRYASFPSLYEYCYRAAGVVGLIMLKIFGSRDESCAAYAVKLGVAMQLTNILRDIGEDLTRGRIYLPQDELLKFGVSEAQLQKGQNNAAFKELISFQIRRNDQLYREALPGIKLISHRRARLVVLAMLENYHLILKSIQKNDFDVFSRRTQVNSIKKIFTVFKILGEGKYL